MRTIIFFGGGLLLSKLIKISLKKKIKCVVFTSSRHANEKILNNFSFQKFLKSNKIIHFITKKLSINKLNVFINNNCIGFSIGSAWIFKKKIINIFKSNIYNIHGAKLPLDRGGGGFSWQIMQNKNNGYACLHKINQKIDYGDIVQISKFTTKHFYNPIDWQEKYIKVSTLMFKKNLTHLFSNKIKIKKQLKKNSTYWPRLDTETHGWINWNWSGNEIITFIKAFGSPYKGAHTLLNKKIIYFKNCRFKQTQNFHPFQCGLIMRKYKKKIFISVRDGIIETNDVYNKSGKKEKFKNLKIGDRFFSPSQKLEKALTTRVYYNL